jgi:hypothetical protein
MPILSGIGKGVFIDAISESDLQEALAYVQAWRSERKEEARQTA